MNNKHTKVWDLSFKSLSAKEIPSLKPSQLLLQVEKIHLDRDFQVIEGIGRVKSSGSQFKNLQDKRVAFIQKERKDLIQELEIVEGELVEKSLETALLHPALTVLMMQEFIMSTRPKNILHVTDNKTIAGYLKKVVKGNLVTVIDKSSLGLIHVFDFDLIFIGKVPGSVCFDLELKAAQTAFCYENVRVNLRKGQVIKKTVNKWLGGLTQLRKKQFFNYIKNNPDLFSARAKNLNFTRNIETSLQEDYFEVLIENLHSLAVSEGTFCYSLKPQEDLSSCNSSFNEGSLERQSPETDKACTVEEVIYENDEIISFECLRSPKNSLGSLEDQFQMKTLENSLNRFEPTFSESTDFSMSPENSYDFINQLILKYKNSVVDRIVSQFESVFEKDIREACKYLRILPDFSIYEGELSDTDLAHGFGSRYFTDGTVFRGFWYLGKANGKGIMANADGSFYFGEWKNGNYHGYGSLVNEQGDVHEGFFKRGKFHGVGLEKMVNGQNFQGYFCDGQRLQRMD